MEVWRVHQTGGYAMSGKNSKAPSTMHRWAPSALAFIALQGLAFLPQSPLHGLSAQAAAGPADLWYIIKIAGQPAGYIHEVTKAEGQGLKTDSGMLVVLNRLGSRGEIGFLSISAETPEGLLRRVRYEMTASAQTTKSEAVISEGKVEIRNASGGKTYSNTLNYTGELQ